MGKFKIKAVLRKDDCLDTTNDKFIYHWRKMERDRWYYCCQFAPSNGRLNTVLSSIYEKINTTKEICDTLIKLYEI